MTAPPAPTPREKHLLTCVWVFGHAWDKWRVYQHGPLRIRDEFGGSLGTSYYVDQWRRCARCGRLQLRRAKR